MSTNTELIDHGISNLQRIMVLHKLSDKNRGKKVVDKISDKVRWQTQK